MFVNDALSRLHIEAQEDIHDMIPLTFLHLNTTHIRHNYEQLAYNLYMHKSKHAITKSNKGRQQKLPNASMQSRQKHAKMNFMQTNYGWHVWCIRIYSQQSQETQSLLRLQEGIPSRSQANFENPAENIL